MDKIKELDGVGPKTAEKLKESGYNDFMSIAAASAGEVAEGADVGEATAQRIISSARKKVKMGFDSADKILEKRKEIGKITTGSKMLDDLLGGGVESRSITEVHGAYGSSKTQLALQLAVNVQLSEKKGGLEGSCVFIDTEGTFRPERAVQMAKALGLEPDKALKNIYVARAYNSDHQVLLAEKSSELLEKKKVRLLVIDSLTGLFRSDYTGRGELAARQQKLNRHLHDLQRLSDIHNISIYVTNQVMANPAVLFGDPTTAIGGHVLGHAATFRIYLRKSKKNTRVGRLIDSPSMPEGEAVFVVNEKGIRDK